MGEVLLTLVSCIQLILKLLQCGRLFCSGRFLGWVWQVVEGLTVGVAVFGCALVLNVLSCVILGAVFRTSICVWIVGKERIVLFLSELFGAEFAAEACVVGAI